VGDDDATFSRDISHTREVEGERVKAVVVVEPAGQHC